MFSRNPSVYTSASFSPNPPIKEFFDAVKQEKEEELREYFQNSNYQVWTLKEENDYTALHRAVFMGSENIVNLIIEELKKRLGLDSKIGIPKFINEKTNEGITALHYAAYKGNMNIVKILISNGANVEAVTNRGKNVMHLAAEGNQPSMMMYFLHYQGQDILSIDDYGSTPLHWACYSGAEEVVMFLLSQKADINAKDKEGLTPLYLAVNSKRENIVLKLLQNGADKNIEDNRGEKPYNAAVKKNYYTISSLLEDQDFNPLCTLETAKEKIKGEDIWKKIIFVILFVPEIIKLLCMLPYLEGLVETFVNLSFFILVLIFYIILLLKQPFYATNEQLIIESESQNPLKVLIDKGQDIKIYCPMCYVIKRNSIKHCFICNKCVEDFEHHCFWLNRCIGKGNKPWYCVFLVFALLHSLCTIYVSVMCFMSDIYNPEKKGIWENITIGKGSKRIRVLASAVVFILAIVCLIPLVFLIMIMIVKQLGLLKTQSSQLQEGRLTDVSDANKKEEKSEMKNMLEISLVDNKGNEEEKEEDISNRELNINSVRGDSEVYKIEGNLMINEINKDNKEQINEEEQGNNEENGNEEDEGEQNDGENQEESKENTANQEAKE